MARKIGTRAEVWNGTAQRTRAGLTKADLFMEGGRIKSRRQQKKPERRQQTGGAAASPAREMEPGSDAPHSRHGSHLLSVAQHGTPEEMHAMLKAASPKLVRQLKQVFGAIGPRMEKVVEMGHRSFGVNPNHVAALAHPDLEPKHVRQIAEQEGEGLGKFLGQVMRFVQGTTVGVANAGAAAIAGAAPAIASLAPMAL